MKELEVAASADCLDAVIDFINAQLAPVGCPAETKHAIDIAAEEVFVNIAQYAYPAGASGKAVIEASFSEKPLSLHLTFMDWGRPYNPLAHPDPDVKALSLEQRRGGGMGVYIVKKSMDAVDYEYKDGKNILTIKKNL